MAGPPNSMRAASALARRSAPASVGPVDPDVEDALERRRVDECRRHADALGDEALPGLGERRHDAGEGHGIELVEAVAIEREERREHRGHLVGGGVGARDGPPGAGQSVVLEEADGDVRVADVGRQQLHRPYRSSRSAPLRHAGGRC